MFGSKSQNKVITWCLITGHTCVWILERLRGKNKKNITRSKKKQYHAKSRKKANKRKDTQGSTDIL